MIEPCTYHRIRLGFVQRLLDAEQRLARGELQAQCPTCLLWLWPHEVGAPAKLEYAAFARVSAPLGRT